jgi:L-alanine-DL-glutamate epimerase-like enolase superfamily enzyme
MKDLEIERVQVTLQQAANLHLMLAYPNCTCFEQPVPYPALEFGMIDTIRTDREGLVHAPAGPGLGVRIDWDAVKSATLVTLEQPGAASRLPAAPD